MMISEVPATAAATPPCAASPRRTSASTEISIIDPCRDLSWDREILSHPDATFFHGSAWAAVLQKTYGHEPLYLRCARGGQPATLLPLMEVRSRITGRRGVCLPFTDVCGPLQFDGQTPETFCETLCNLGRERRWRHVELRTPAAGVVSSFYPSLFHIHTMTLDRDPNVLFNRLKSSVRNALRKAEHSQLHVEVTRSRESMQEFYRLHTQTRRRHGLPPQSLAFFLNIHEAVLTRDLGFVVLVKKGNRPAAGAIFFHLGKKALYKFGASDTALQEFRPSNLAIWEGIQELSRHGCESLHFGRTAPENVGLRKFKLGWGSVEETVCYQRFDPVTGAGLPGRDDRPGWHHAVFRRLPGAVNRLAGAMIYPHLD